MKKYFVLILALVFFKQGVRLSLATEEANALNKLPKEVTNFMYNSFLNGGDQRSFSITCRTYRPWFKMIKVDGNLPLNFEEVDSLIRKDPDIRGIKFSNPKILVIFKALKALLIKYPRIVWLDLENNSFHNCRGDFNNQILEISKEAECFKNIIFLNLKNASLDELWIESFLNLNAPHLRILNLAAEFSLRKEHGLQGIIYPKLMKISFEGEILPSIKYLNLGRISLQKSALFSLITASKKNPHLKETILILEDEDRLYKEENPTLKKELELNFPKLKWVKNLDKDRKRYGDLVPRKLNTPYPSKVEEQLEQEALRLTKNF